MSESYAGPSDAPSVFRHTDDDLARNLATDLESEGGDVLRAVHRQCTSMEKRLRAIEATLENLQKDSAATRSLINGLFLRLPAASSRATVVKGVDHASQTVLVSKYFSQEFIQRVVSFNIPLSAFSRHQKSVSGEKREFPLLFLGAMMYSGGSTDEGRRSSAAFLRQMCKLRDENRTAIVRNLVFNVGKRAEKAMEHESSSQPRSHGSSRAEEGGREAGRSQDSSTPTPSIIRQVPWMSPGFFKNSHFHVQASDDAETTTPLASGRKKRKVLEGSDVSQDEVAALVVKQVRTLLNEFVNRGRYLSRKEFAADLGFLLTPIKRDGETVNISIMPCPADGSQAGDSPPPEEENWNLIPECYPTDAKDDRRANDDLYADVLYLGKCSGMAWIVEYDVMVEGTTKEKEVRTLCRVVDLVEVSLNFCIAYFQSRDRNHFFNSSVHSLRLVYCIALAFRRLIRESSARAPSNSNSEFTISGLCSEAFAIQSYLLSSPDVFAKVVDARVVNMKLERFETLNTPNIIEVHAGPDPPGEGEDSQNSELVENEEEGLVLIPDL
jgi:hypothetical protein